MGLAWSSRVFSRSLRNRKGVEMLGSGAFGAVYSFNEKSSRVLKVSTIDTDAWPIYARWCIEHGRSHVNALRVYSIHEMNHDNSRVERFVIASIERLDRISYAPSYLGDLCHYVTDLFEYARNTKASDYKRACKKVEAYQPDLISMVQQLEMVRSEFGCTEDMHTGNMMYRKSTNSIVITDPFGSTSTRGLDISANDRTNIGRIRTECFARIDQDGQYRMRF